MKKIPAVWLSALSALCLAALLTACTGTGGEAGTETIPGETVTEPAGTVEASDTLPADTDAGTEAGTTAEADTGAASEAVTEAPEPDEMRAGGTVRVVSYNLDANLDTAASRSKGMISILQGLAPDSFGVQECRPVWLNLLEKGMPEYAHIGLSADGENPNVGTFGTYVFYRKDKYDVVDSGTFWLSKTPDVPSMYGPTVDCNRTCCWVILEDKETGFRYVHMNSHLDWMDVNATNYQIELIRSQVEVFEKMGLPVFATGDYNVDEGTDTYNRMLKSAVIGDAKFEAGVSMDLGTYPDYDRYDVTKTKPIDFCFVTKGRMTVNEYRVVNDKYNDKYVSDHFGLCIDAAVPELPDLYVTAPAPAMNGELTISDVKPNRFVVSFPAATAAAAPVTGYRITVAAADGSVVYEETVSSGRLLPEPPASFSCAAGGLTAETDYTVSVTALDLFGKESVALTASAKTAVPAPSEAIGPADIFDLFLDDTWVDVSDAALEIKKVGTVKVEEREGRNALVFGGGNLKVPGIKDYYSTLALGFTMELDVTVGRIDKFTSLMSNMHAGGFGYDIENGRLAFELYCGGSYREVSVLVNTGDRLHLVAVYDGSVLTLYVNGELQDQQKVGKVSSFATDNGAKYLCIGADSDASGAGEYPTDSVIYLARIWSEPATAGQAKYLYEMARG